MTAGSARTGSRRHATSGNSSVAAHRGCRRRAPGARRGRVRRQRAAGTGRPLPSRRRERAPHRACGRGDARADARRPSRGSVPRVGGYRPRCGRTGDDRADSSARALDNGPALSTVASAWRRLDAHLSEGPANSRPRSGERGSMTRQRTARWSGSDARCVRAVQGTSARRPRCTTCSQLLPFLEAHHHQFDPRPWICSVGVRLQRRFGTDPARGAFVIQRALTVGAGAALS
jgi:hypothetical protein